MNHPVRQLVWQDLLLRHAESKPSTPAFKYLDRTVTWGDAEQTSAGLAGFLATRGISAGDRVLLLMRNSDRYPLALLALHRIGACAVPVNFRLAPDEVEFLALDSGISGVVFDEELAPLLSGVHARHAEAVWISADESTSVANAVPWSVATSGDRTLVPEVAPVDLNDTAMLLYTSGTTGMPKGAMLSYQNLVSGCLTSVHMHSLNSENEVRMIGTPLFHIAAMHSMLSAMLMGQTSIINSGGTFDPEEFLDVIEREGVTNLFLVPTQWQAVCDSPTLADRSLSLCSVSWGASAASRELLVTMRQVLGGVRIVSTLGQTETAGVSTCISSEEWLERPGSVGRPVQNMSVRVVDENMCEVPVGQPGEIVYRGPSVMTGYWNRADANADAFRGGWFHSGDLVVRDEDGYLYVVDRLKDMIISGGENIYPAELERVIIEHPRVAEVSVVGRPHDRWGETPVACIVAVDAAEPVETGELREWLGDRVARFKLPGEVVMVAELPKNASGKVRKNVLRDLVVGDDADDH